MAIILPAGALPAAIQLGLQSLITAPVRGIESQYKIGEPGYFTFISADVVVEEIHEDHLEITDHPVENGTNITDHSFKRPIEVKVSYGWSESPKGQLPWYANVGLTGSAAAGLLPGFAAKAAGYLEAGAALNTFLNKKSQVEKYYQALQYLQETRALVTLWTGRRKYKNMLLKSLSTTVDYKSANSMVIDITARQIIMVTTDVVSLKGDAAAISKRGQQYLNAATRAGG